MADEIEDNEDDRVEEKTESRRRDLSKIKSVNDFLLKLFTEVEDGFRDQWNRSNDQMDWWDVYNCKLTSRQFYSGNSQIFVPIVLNAVNARKTRFTNQIFPVSGRYVEVTSSDGTKPDALTALLEHYVRKAKLRTRVMPAMAKCGDVEGQYNLAVSWCDRKRHVTFRTTSQPEIEEGVPNPAAEEVDDIQEETVTESHPEVEVLSDSDVLVLPQTCDSKEEAIEDGGSVTMIRRWSKAKIKKMIKDKFIRKDAGDALIEQMQKKSPPEVVNASKKMVDAAGIKGDGKKHALVYETYTKLEAPGWNEPRLCRVFFGGESKVLGAHRNPLWCDKVPLLSVPVEKVHGAFKGKSKVSDCADMQYAANDAVNEGWDSAAYALLPIVMTDPEKNPRVGSMVLSMAAVWETSPKDTQFAQFPQLWMHAFEMVNACKAEVSQTLSVSPAAITQGAGAAGKSKPNQAMVAQEQMIDILTTADAVTVIEEGILTPLLDLFIELDHQYRDEEITVRQFGEMGLRAEMEKIPPIQMDGRYQFRWFGVEQARNAQQIQQQIAGMNVIRGIPPQQLNGYTINLVPIITQLVENTFGPRLAPLIFLSPEQQMPVPVDQENHLLAEGFEAPVHKMDDDQQHIQGHQQALQMMEMTGENKNRKKFLAHIWQHVQQGQAKQQAAMQPQGGEPGVPGGAGPGVAGTPRQGAQPGQPRAQGPAGMIHQDQMRDPRMMPRKVG